MTAPVRLAALLLTGCSVTELSVTRDAGSDALADTARQADRVALDAASPPGDVAHDGASDATPSPRDPPDGAVVVTLDDATPSCPSPELGCGRAWVRGGTVAPYPRPPPPFGFIPDSPGVFGNSQPTSVGGFVLDRYEVTVRRFRRFWLAGMPAVKDDVRYPGGVWPWPRDVPILEPWTRERCGAVYSSYAQSCAEEPFTWSQEAGTLEDHPVFGVTISTAQAFCVWDGGRLPTAAEWFYAAYGLADGRPLPRMYAWGDDYPCGRDNLYSVSHPVLMGSDAFCAARPPGIEAVGQRSANGTFYNLDGNVSEVVADHYYQNGQGSMPVVQLPFPSAADPLYVAPGYHEWTVHGGGIYARPGGRSSYLELTPCAFGAQSGTGACNGYRPRLCSSNCGVALTFGFRCAYDVPPMSPTEP